MADPEKLRRVVNRIVGLPTLPAMLTQINRLMINPRTSAKEVAQLISSDPAITAKILRVVNSSFYGFPNRITTVTHAIVILGFNTIKSIVLSSSIFEVFRKDSREARFDRTDFWKHSIGVGAASKVVAKQVGYSALEEFFIAGLLHDIGKIVLYQFLHDEFLKLLDLVEEQDILMVEAETELLGGITHGDVGSWLFKKWNLSRGVVECTSSHHNPAIAGEHIKPVSVVHMADILSRAMSIGSGGDGRIPAISDTAWETLGLSTANIDPLMQEIEEEADKAMIFLDFAR